MSATQSISSGAATSAGGPRAETPLYGLLGEFEDVTSVVEAADAVREAGFRRWDVHSPFPIHGIENHMGIRSTILPWISLLGGLGGLSGGVFLVWWANASSFDVPYYFRGYEFMISGKPIFSLPANIPIIFEVTVLGTAILTFVGMLLLNRLPWLRNPLHNSERFRRVTEDRFFVVIEADDPRFERDRVESLLRDKGANAVEAVHW